MNLQVAVVGNRDGRLFFHRPALRSFTAQARPANSVINVVNPLVLSSISIPVSRISTFSTSNRISRLSSREKQQHSAAVLPNLTDEEQSVYCGIKINKWGQNVRLEQERINWSEAWNCVQKIRI